MAKVRADKALTLYLRKYLLAPRYRAEERLSLVTDDGVHLAAWRLEGPPEADVSFVVVHGFANWSRTPAVYRFARLLARGAHVVVPDLRGHGQSGGRCSMGRDEVLDVAAAVAAAAAAAPGLPVVTVGCSLGAAAVVLHAGTGFATVAGVVAVSGPAWSLRPTPDPDLGEGSASPAMPSRGGPGAVRVSRWVSTRRGRAVLAIALRTRVAADRALGDVLGAAARLTVPAVVVHDPDDWYFGADHADALHAALAGRKELWWYPGGGHGTDLLTPGLADLLLSDDQRSRWRHSAISSDLQ